MKTYIIFFSLILFSSTVFSQSTPLGSGVNPPASTNIPEFPSDYDSPSTSTPLINDSTIDDGGDIQREEDTSSYGGALGGGTETGNATGTGTHFGGTTSGEEIINEEDL